jgi:hypothetical protein
VAVMRLGPVVWLVACVLAASCVPLSFGDPAHGVTLENTLSVPVTVYEQGRDVPKSVRDVPAASSVQSAWLWPPSANDTHTRRVEATTADGQFVFCKGVTFADLEKVNWHIRIVREGCA